MDNGTGLAAWLLGYLTQFQNWLLGILQSLFVGVWDLLTDLLIFLIDRLLELVVYGINGMGWDFSSFSPLTYWNQLPADLISTLNLLGVPIALGMIVAALSVRFVLQLIPFVRLGS